MVVASYIRSPSRQFVQAFCSTSTTDLGAQSFHCARVARSVPLAGAGRV